MVEAAVVDGPLAAALAENRDRVNALVADARRTRADFDVGLLKDQIRGPLRAMVESCEAASSGSGVRVLGAVFGPVMELVGQHRVGGGTHDELMEALPRFSIFLVDDPRLVFGSLANAVVHLRQYARPVDLWLDRLSAAAEHCAGADTFLSAGQVAAWTVGMAHYRQSALDTLESLPRAVTGAVLGVDGADPAAIASLRRDRWWRPDRKRPRAPTVAHRVGGFRGFGGPFLGHPQLGTRETRVFAQSSNSHWELHADAWGATLTRTGIDWIDLRPTEPVDLPAGIEPVSAASSGEITAVVTATSYEVIVVEPAA